ncbi:ANTAR domain-containing response regulator [Methylomonas methanica]|uniref:Response regulator receiver and ANTAR domain protein n=1 Tax=Methylomonas methanica (strain DSM 25384 / MC09) TaxID=857087 RepID=G0A709_METMM|nr:ANTAR domain-containing protein [Methylomonas methanica]AEG01803.1 response regulator receiver and ANTAR domain protein [Methylomonas methanica MC09]
MTPRKVLVVDEFDSDLVLEKNLTQHGYQVATLKLQELNLLEVVKSLQPDAVVLNLYAPNEKVLEMILTINREHSVPVIVFAEDQQTETINKVIKAGVSAYIVDGLEPPRRVKAIIEVAIARFHEQKALKDELQKTRNQLEERKLVDRAKAILIKSQNYNEDQAYHALRKLAMDRKVSLGEMAKNVIAMAELFK